MNLVEEEQLLLKDIFLVKVNQNQTGDSLVPLTQFPNDLKNLGESVSLLDHQTLFDSLLMERLQMPKVECLKYLSDCLNRCNFQNDKPWNQAPHSQKFINYASEIIRNFIYLAATDPQIFPEQLVIDTEAEKSTDKILAVAMRLLTHFELHGFDYEILASIYPRIAKEEKNGDTLLQNLAEVLLARQRFQTIADSKCLLYCTVLINLLAMPDFRQRFIALPRSPFIPSRRESKQINGNTLDLYSPLGLFGRPSLLGNLVSTNQQIKANGMFEERVLADFIRIKYKKDFDAKIKYYTTMETEYLAQLKEIFKQLLKKDTQKSLFEWIYALIVGNQMRTKLGSRLTNVNVNTISSDGLMLNIYECMMEISRPILDLSNGKYQSVDPEYFYHKEHAKLCQYEPLKKSQGNKMQLDRKDFGTITEFYFLSWELLHTALIPTLHNFQEVNEAKQRLEKELVKVPKNHPMMPQYERELTRLKLRFYQYYLVLLDDLKVKQAVRLMDTILILLPQWLGIDLSRFRKGVIGQLKRPYLPTMLPEFLLNDIFEFHQFYCRIKQNYIHILGQQHINNIINMICLLLADDHITSNPYICANYIEMLFYFIQLDKNGMVSQLLKNNEMAISNMTLGLVRFYSDIAFTGSRHQFYSKYKYRYYTNKIFTVLWRFQAYRAALKEISKTEQFQRFINMIITDSTYCFDEINQKYSKIKEYEVKKANKTMSQEDLRDEEMVNGAMAGNLQQSVSNLKLLKNLSGWSPETFHAEAFLSTTVPLLDNMLKTLVEPATFANDLAIVNKYSFKKDFVLSHLLTIYVNLNHKDILVNEIIRDDRSYKKEYFTVALQKASNQNCTEDQILQGFQRLIGQLSTAKKEQEEDQTIYGEIPEQYLCNIIGSLLKDPVLLPTSNKVVDRMYIHKHLLNDERDPFNRKPLKLSELVEQPKLKKQIEEWKKRRLEQLRQPNNQSKFGKKGEKKKEEVSDNLVFNGINLDHFEQG